MVTAEATLKSTLNRKESRGAHQRKDFPKINEEELKNHQIELDGQSLKITSINLKTLENRLMNVVQKTKEISDFKGKLIE